MNLYVFVTIIIVLHAVITSFAHYQISLALDKANREKDYEIKSLKEQIQKLEGTLAETTREKYSTEASNELLRIELKEKTDRLDAFTMDAAAKILRI